MSEDMPPMDEAGPAFGPDINQHAKLMEQCSDLNKKLQRLGVQIREESLMGMRLQMLIERVLGSLPTEDDGFFSPDRLDYEITYLKHVKELMEEGLSEAKRKNLKSAGGPGGIIIPNQRQH